MKSISISVLFSLMCCISVTYAQTSECKPKVNANKNKILVYDGIEISHVSWQHDEAEITRQGDSVIVKKGDSNIARFTLNNTHIAGSIYTEYYPDGTIKLIDSLGYESKWQLKRYWGEYYGSVINSKKYNSNGILQKATYYTRRGRDSLTLKWYPDGKLHQSTWGEKEWGSDSSTHTWNQKGVLLSIETRKFLKELYPTGALKSLSSDTIISERSVLCKREYDTTGILRSITYHCVEKPCHTWLYYTEKGKLAKTVQQPEVSSIIEYDMIEHHDIISEISTREITQPGFSKYEPLHRYFNEALAEAVCYSTLPLANEYQIKFIVDYNGKAIFEGITGQNHTALLEVAKKTIEEMPQWSPARKGKKTVKTGLIVKIYVKDI